MSAILSKPAREGEPPPRPPPIAPRPSDCIMRFPDYGFVRLTYGSRPLRRCVIIAHAGYFSERRFARYAAEIKSQQMTRLQAHHSYRAEAWEGDNIDLWRYLRQCRTGKVDRDTFSSSLTNWFPCDSLEEHLVHELSSQSFQRLVAVVV